MNDEKQPASGNIRSALNILAELRAGQVVTELSAAIHDAVAAVNQHDKKAVVILRLSIAPASEAKLVERSIIFTPEIESKLPTETPDSTLFFIDADGNPSRTVERRQPDLGFKVAESGSSNAGTGD